MNAKEKLLLVGLLLVVALSFFLGHFWSYTICALQKVAATEIVPLLFFTKFTAGITGALFLL